MKTALTSTLILFAALLYAAEDGGLTGEQDPAAIPTAQETAIAIRNANREFGQICALQLQKSVNIIIRGATEGADQTANATAFWSRIGNKGKRTLKWLTDLRDAADAAAPSGTDYIPAATRAMLAKWSANPDNTVTVTP